MLADYEPELCWFGSLEVTAIVGLPPQMQLLVQPASSQMNRGSSKRSARCGSEVYLALAYSMLVLMVSPIVRGRVYSAGGARGTVIESGLKLPGR